MRCEIDEANLAPNYAAIPPMAAAMMPHQLEVMSLNYIQKLLNSAFEARHRPGN